MEPDRLNVLISYAFANPNVMALLRERRADVRVLIDSGAFTAYRVKKLVTLAGYCRMLDRLSFQPYAALSLDAIGDPGTTLANYRSMLRAGFKPMPVFQRGAPIDHLDAYYETSPCVAIGGLVGQRGSKSFVNGVMERVAGRPVHWLGFTEQRYLSYYRPRSCDTAGWEITTQYGKLLMCFRGGARHTWFKRDPLHVQHAEQLRALGVDTGMLAYEKAWAGGASYSRLVAAVMAVEHAKRVERELGTLHFTVFINEQALTYLLRAWDHLKGKKNELQHQPLA